MAGHQIFDTPPLPHFYPTARPRTVSAGWADGPFGKIYVALSPQLLHGWTVSLPPKQHIFVRLPRSGALITVILTAGEINGKLRAC